MTGISYPDQLVVIESPFAGKAPDGKHCPWLTELNLTYLRACMHDCVKRGESPYASHALLTQPGVLDDLLPEERAKGITMGFWWGARADARVFYLDRGFSSGMSEGLKEAIRLKQPTVIRGLAQWRSPLRLEALRKLNGELPSGRLTVDWGGL